MKNFKLLVVLAVTVTLYSCGSDEPKPDETGSFQIAFNNMVGSAEVALKTSGSTDYDYETADEQQFNISTFGYYISKIVLEGPNGEYFEDPMQATASSSSGYYHVTEAESASQTIVVDGVPAGHYNKVTFNVGVSEDGVAEGAAGGVLDIADGAWFWNWNAGYVAFKLEGAAENAGSEAGTYAFHVGGWKEVTDNENFVNNVKTVELEFGTSVIVSEDFSPLAHIAADALKVLDGASVDFSTTYSIHSPKAGETLANELPEVFTFLHVHQSSN